MAVVSDLPPWARDERDHDYPDAGPECCVDGCDHRVPGLKHGYEPSTREGIACNHCWDFVDAHGHWPDEEDTDCRVCGDGEVTDS